MAGTKKRLKKLVAAVSEILDDQAKAKKLKKAEALERFIAKLEKKHREMEAALATGSFDRNALEDQTDRAKNLAKQIRRAKKILADIRRIDERTESGLEA